MYSKNEKIYTGKHILVVLMYHITLKWMTSVKLKEHILENFHDIYDYNSWSLAEISSTSNFF